MSARDEVLRRVRAALEGVERQPDPIVTPATHADGVPASGLLDLFAERVADYRAEVVRCLPDAVATTVAAALPPGARVVVPDGLGLDVPGAVVDDGMTARELDAVDAVVTAAASASPRPERWCSTTPPTRDDARSPLCRTGTCVSSAPIRWCPTCRRPSTGSSQLGH